LMIYHPNAKHESLETNIAGEQRWHTTYPDSRDTLQPFSEAF
jgi:hypothetical protein